MSSLSLLMQNYSDSEDESSDEERKKKRLRKLTIEQQNVEKNEQVQNKEEQQVEKVKKDEAVEERIHYSEDYLEDDFYTLNTHENDDEEMNANDNSDQSIIEDDNNEKADDASSNNKDDQIEKLDCSKYSPKSYHRHLIGIDEENIQIPDAPNKQCNEELIQKVINYHKKMKQGMNMNKSIQSMKSFRNPSIYEKLVSFCNIDEFGTNLPSEIFDPDLYREKEHDTST